jgi:hypothetical protein
VGATIKIAVLAQAAKAKAEMDSIGKSAKTAGDKVKASLGNLAGAAKAGAVGAGLAAGAMLVGGIGQALEQGKLNAKLGTQLGLTKDEAAKVGKLSGQVYADGFGEDIGQVNEAVKGVYQQIGKGSAEWTKQTTQDVLTVANAFDQDLGGTTAAVGQLMKTGLAKNAQEALDIMTVGFQSGADKAGDLLDTFTEYGTQFRKLGIDGKQATGLLSQGLQAGARDADTVADAIKEFSIRAIDGSKATGEGFKGLGLSAKQMASDIAAGGPKANAALDTTLDRLRAVKDPVERAQLAVQLFGTKAEDLGDALYSLDPSSAVSAIGQVEGAAKRAGDTMQDTASAKVERLKRSFSQGFTEAVGSVVTKFDELIKKVPPEVWDGIGDSIDSLKDAVKTAYGAWKDMFGAVTDGMTPTELLLQTLRALRATIDALVIVIDGLVGAYQLTSAAVYALVAGYRSLTGDVSGANEAWKKSETSMAAATEAAKKQSADVQKLKDNWNQGGETIKKANEKAAAAAATAAKKAGDAHNDAGARASAAHATAAAKVAASQAAMGVDASSASSSITSSHAVAASKTSSTWSGVPGKIKGYFSNADLSGSGSSVMGSFLSGAKSTWNNSIAPWLSARAAEIRALKGPPDKDRVLLMGAGELVMSGFLSGLESEYKRIRSSLTEFTESLSTPSGLHSGSATQMVDVTRPVNDSSSTPIIIQFAPGGDPLMDAIWEQLRKRIRITGGNVQMALGR